MPSATPRRSVVQKRAVTLRSRSRGPFGVNGRIAPPATGITTTPEHRRPCPPERSNRAMCDHRHFGGVGERLACGKSRKRVSALLSVPGGPEAQAVLSRGGDKAMATPGSIRERLPEWCLSLEGPRKLVLNGLILIFSLLGSGVVIKAALKQVYVVDAISVPKDLETNGYTSA